jgi:1-deoxy-D-xylulose-5-phosphate reductoisomerase
VQAFLERRIGFLEIAALVEDALERADGAPARDLDDLLTADAEARRLAEREITVA